jgi:hypothetical protein
VKRNHEQCLVPERYLHCVGMNTIYYLFFQELNLYMKKRIFQNKARKESGFFAF